MSTHVDELREQVKRAETALSELRAQWHAAMIEAEPLKVGDVVRVTTPRARWTFADKELNGAKCNPLPAKVEYGRVRAVTMRYSTVDVEIAPQTKTGFHGRTTIGVSYDSIVEKIAAIPESKEAL